MPNIYQWIVFICTVAALFIEITDFDFFRGGTRTSPLPNIEAFLLIGLTSFVGFFLYRVAGKVKKKKSNDQS